MRENFQLWAVGGEHNWTSSRVSGQMSQKASLSTSAVRPDCQFHSTAKARKAYQDFLALWKDADPDIRIYQQAKAEYAKLK